MKKEGEGGEDGGDGEDNAPKKEEEVKEEENEEGVKKFNPKEFSWSNTNGNPLPTRIIYNKMKPALWVILLFHQFFLGG